MRRILLILGMIGIPIIFGILSQAIVSVKVQELRFEIGKDQLLNFELSSKLLKDKFKQMLLDKDNFSNEIQVNVMESNVMNSTIGKGDIEMSNGDYVGLFVINLVRTLSLKDAIRLSENRKDMMIMQFAFLMERTRKFSAASKKYEELESRFQGRRTNEYGFILLHNGFCLALMGEVDKAIQKLEKTEETFPATHYSANARIIINLLKENQHRKEKIQENLSSNKSELAVALFDTGQYRDTLNTLNAIENRSNGEDYMRARSFEELGESKNAIDEYVKLAEKAEDKDIAKKANRRLVIIGNIYEKNDKISSYSKKKAEELGDKEAVAQVEEGASKMETSKIIEVLKNPEPTTDSNGKPSTDTSFADELKDIKEELQTELATIQEEPPKKEGERSFAEQKLEEEFKKAKEEEEIAKKKKEEEEIARKKREEEEEIARKKREDEELLAKKRKEEEEERRKLAIQNLTLNVNLVDGRTFHGNKINFDQGKFTINTKSFPLTLPDAMLNEVDLSDKKLGVLIKITTTEGKVIQTSHLKKTETEFIFLKGKSEESISNMNVKSISF